MEKLTNHILNLDKMRFLALYCRAIVKLFYILWEEIFKQKHYSELFLYSNLSCVILKAKEYI